ncbi:MULTISPECIES: AEC family transporter [Enorma]|uniref:AEC family transporter n=1 Tax=Enorma TaxID=1472762 RepID=UPI001E5CB2E5|nr:MULTISPECIES: AEC family transporter [Enorma]
MESALLSVLSFVTIILLGIAAARFNLVGKSADKLISTIVFKLTLPATIIHAFGTTEVAPAMLGIVLVGFACSAIPYAIAFFVTRHMDACDRPLFLFGAGGMNIGCFALPFIQAIFPASSVVTVCLIDAGNSIVVTGGSFALTKALLSGDAEGHRGRAMAKRLFSSIPFDCYIVLIAFVLLGIRVPDAVISFVEPIANANAFLSLLMLGLMTSTHVGEGKLDKLVGVLGLRVAVSLALSLAAFFLLPYDYLTRCVIATVIWAPMSALAPLYTLWCGGDHGLAGLAGTISIVLGIAAMLCVITCSGVL